MPFGFYTEVVGTMSLMAAARIYKLRIDPNAQKEIQEIADQMGKLIQPLFPYSWKHLTAPRV